MRLSLLILIAMSHPSFGAPFIAEVVGGGGDIRYRGQPIGIGAKLSEPGLIKVGRGPGARIRMAQDGSEVHLSMGAQIELQKPLKKVVHFKAVAGTTRWVAKPKKKKSSLRRQVRTKAAVMGVSANDLMIVVNPLLGETEAVVFDGQVVFQSARNKRDRRLIRKGEWGGIGGRFTKKVGKALRFPTKVLEAFRSVTLVR